MRKSLFLLACATLWTTTAWGWTFGVLGDTRDDKHGIFPRILAAAEESGMEFLIHTGDLEHEGGTKSWEAFKARATGFSKPLHVVVGNHELHGSTSGEFARFFGLPGPSYSFTHKDAHFAVIDDGNGTLPDPVLEWLDNDLAAHPSGNGGIAFLVVAMHVPPRTDNIFPHGTAKNFQEQSEKLLKVLLRHKVALLLASHEHIQLVDDWAGIKVVVSGGGGAPMVPFHKFGFYRIDLENGNAKETFVPVKSGSAVPPAR